MASPFETAEMAAGYANSRPPVHAAVVERVATHLQLAHKLNRGLDVGCGAGLSTKALKRLAHVCLGIEPVEAMLRCARKIVTDANFLAGSAEALPLGPQCVDIITAAGSLNYVQLDLFFAEAVRVLAAHGVVVIYDFFPGRSFSDSPALDEWFRNFTERYPWPPGEANEISPEILSGVESELKIRSSEHFEIALPLNQKSYIDYMMTETNVAFAGRRGVAQEEIRTWCLDTLQPIFNNSVREVLVRGYFVCMDLN